VIRGEDALVEHSDAFQRGDDGFDGFGAGSIARKKNPAVDDVDDGERAQGEDQYDDPISHQDNSTLIMKARMGQPPLMLVLRSLTLPLRRTSGFVASSRLPTKARASNRGSVRVVKNLALKE